MQTDQIDPNEELNGKKVPKFADQNNSVGFVLKDIAQKLWSKLFSRIF